MSEQLLSKLVAGADRVRADVSVTKQMSTDHDKERAVVAHSTQPLHDVCRCLSSECATREPFGMLEIEISDLDLYVRCVLFCHAKTGKQVGKSSRTGGHDNCRVWSRDADSRYQF
ncbi:hypothetical protein ASF80_16100 [Microbacterium sp. Leaf159]|nr:hypothetical protein ASF80_16100 [Microbacterium sp. Leaf159]